MAAKLPYMVSSGLVTKILSKVQEARRPDRFTLDYLGTMLGYTSGSAKPIIPLLKRLGFLNSDGTPTSLYDQFRNNDTQGFAMAQGIRNAYSELFDRNEFAGNLPKDKLRSLIMEVTGAAHDDRAVEATASTFGKLKEFADFDAGPTSETAPALQQSQQGNQVPVNQVAGHSIQTNGEEVGLNLAYTVNIVLPETTNPEVFDNIFRSLRENLLKKT